MASTLLFFLCAVFSGFSGLTAQTAYTPDTQNVYHLFTRENPTVSQPMLLGYPTLIGSNFVASRRTVVIIHGWDSQATSPFNVALVPAITAVADVNLIAVDWSAGAMESDYNVLVSHNVPLSGASIARFIEWLNAQTGATIDQYHIIGFEVGAHLAGIVGRNLDGQVPFITVLNPSRHAFNSTNMFASSDGGCTEAIHTDIFGTGVMEPVAHLDFYPNGGLVQPGCDPLDWECSRDRSYQYFVESITSGGFTAARCDSETDAVTGNCDSQSTLPMGGLTNKSGRFGLYFLVTNEQSPFSQG